MKYFFTDCEGPLTKNDNAYEITAHYLPEGSRFYQQLTTYDDILAYLVKKPGYNAGGTLKLILPFFKAYNLNDREIEKFSRKNFLFVPDIIETLSFLRKIMPCFIVSTSYRPYIHALCKTINFPEKNTYATEIDLDKLEIDEKEKIKLKNYAQEIINLPELELPAGVKKFSQLPDKVKKSVQRLNEIFWSEMNNFKSSKFFEIVKPIGGKEKAEAILSQLGGRKELLKNVVYVGDSITDRQAFQVVRKNGGLTISFNGNRYAIESAEIAVISSNAYILAVLGDIFNRYDKEKVLELCKKLKTGNGKLKTLLESSVFSLQYKVFSDWQTAQVFLVTRKNKEKIIEESEKFRKTFRGEKVGEIG